MIALQFVHTSLTFLTAEREIASAGLIRVWAGSYRVQLYAMPTEAQRDVLWDVLEANLKSSEAYDEGLWLDLSDERGTVALTKNYSTKTSPRAILDEVRGWYEDKKVPAGSEGTYTELVKVLKFSVQPERFDYNGYKFWTLPLKDVSRQETDVSHMVSEQRRYDGQIAERNAAQAGVAVGVRVLKSPIKRFWAGEDGDGRYRWEWADAIGERPKWADSEEPHLTGGVDTPVEVGWPAYNMMRRLMSVQEPGQPIPVTKLIPCDIRRGGYVVAKWGADEVRKHFYTDRLKDGYHQQALYFAATGRITGITAEEEAWAAEKLVGEISERAEGIAKLITSTDAESVMPGGSRSTLDDVLAAAVAKLAGLRTGESDQVALVSFAASANGDFVEQMKDAVVGGYDITGIYAAAHEGAYTTFMLKDLMPGKDGMLLTSLYGDAHIALRKIARVANNYWTGDDLKRIDGYENMLNFLSRFPRAKLNGMSGRDIIRDMRHFVGLERMVEALEEEERKSRVSRSRIAAKRKYEVQQLHINDRLGGRIITLGSEEELSQGTRRAIMLPSTGMVVEATDYEILTKYADEVEDVDFGVFRQAWHSVVSPRIGKWISEVVKTLKHRDVNAFVCVDDSISPSFVEWLERAISHSLLGHGIVISFREVYIKDDKVILPEDPIVGGDVLIFSPALQEGTSMVQAALALKEKHFYSPSLRNICGVAFVHSVTPQLTLTDAHLKADPIFGKLSINQINKAYGYNVRKCTEAEFSSSSHIRGVYSLQDSGRNRSIQGSTGGTGSYYPGAEGQGAESGGVTPLGEDKFSVGEIAGRIHIVAPEIGQQKKGNTIYPNAGDLIRDYKFSIGARRRIEIRELFRKHRPDVDPIDVMAYIDEIGKYENLKQQKLAVHWLLAGSIEIPQDNFKIEKAISTAERAKVDPFLYDNPEDIFVAFPQYLPKDKAIDPDTVPELYNRTELKDGIVIYNVSEAVVYPPEVQRSIDMATDPLVREQYMGAAAARGEGRPAGQLAMRNIINTHWGKDASPWCLLQADEDGVLNDQALYYWNHYNSLPKRVAFRDGKLLAFMATRHDTESEFHVTENDVDPAIVDEYHRDSEGEDFEEWMMGKHADIVTDLANSWDGGMIPEQWWDRQDRSFGGVPVSGKIVGDELGRNGTIEYDTGSGEATQVGRLTRGNRRNGIFEEWLDKDTLIAWSEWENGKLIGKSVVWDGRGRVISVQDATTGEEAHWGETGNIRLLLRSGERRSYTNGILDQYSFIDKSSHKHILATWDRTGYLSFYQEQPVDDDGNIMRGLGEDPECTYIDKDNFSSFGESGEEDATDSGFVYPARREFRLKNGNVFTIQFWGESKKIKQIHIFDNHGNPLRNWVFSLFASDSPTLDELRATKGLELAEGLKELADFEVEIQERAKEIRRQDLMNRPARPNIPAVAGLKREDIKFSVKPNERLGDTEDVQDFMSSAEDPDGFEAKFSVATRKHAWEDYQHLYPTVIHSTSHIHMVGHDDPIAHAKYEHFKMLKKYDIAAALSMAEKMAGSTWAKERYIGKYLLGKHFGRLPEALEAARHYFNKAKLNPLHDIIDQKRPVVWVYVHNTDGLNTNKLPMAYAELLAREYGGVVSSEIMKKSDERNTGASMQDRASRNFEWYGKLDLSENPQVFLVDDVWTTGSTTVSLLEYLHDQGADVNGIVTVAVASNTDHIIPTGSDIAKVLSKSHTKSLDEAGMVAGFDMHKLTGSELYAYGVKGAKGKGGLANWFARSFGLFEIPGGLFSYKDERPAATTPRSYFAEKTSKMRPYQPMFKFSVMFPQLNRLSDDEQIVAMLAAGMAINGKTGKDTKAKQRTAIGFFRAHRKETEEMVRRAHPEIANDSIKVEGLAHTLMMRAQIAAREMKMAMEAGVSESAILKRLPRKLEPTYRAELAEQRRGGGAIMGYGMRAKEMLDKKWQQRVAQAVSVQAGVDSDLFEAWTGVDFSETLANVLYNRREESEDRPRESGGVIELPDPEAVGTGSGVDDSVSTKKYKIEEMEDPNRFAEYLVALGWKYWKEKNKLEQSVLPWSDAVSIQFMRKTAQNIYRQLVRDIVYSGARETATKNIDRFENIPTIPGLISAMTFVGEIIHARHIRETKQEMCEAIDLLLRTKLGAQGRFKADREELRRKVSAELELRARYMRHAMWLTKEAAAEEALNLQQRMGKLVATYGETEHNVEQSREYREIQRQLNILREFGALRYRPLGEIETAKTYWEQQAQGSGEEILRAIRAREVRTTKAAAAMAAAVTNPGSVDRVERGAGMALNNYITGHMGFVSLLQDMIRFSRGEDRANAQKIINYIALEVQKAGDRAQTEIRNHSDAFKAAVERIYHRPFNKVMSDMNRRDERFTPFMSTRGGKRVVATKGRAMQLLVSLLQGSKVGDGYFDNVIRHGRKGQAEEIASMLTQEDMNMIAWLGRWYEDNRQGLSEVCESLFGIGVYSESPRYFPVKMLMENQGLESAEGVGWSIFPKALTPRVKNERDFDTSADIFQMWMERMNDGAQWKSHAKLGLEMRGIFGRSELQEAIIASHGAKVNKLILEFITDILSGRPPAGMTESGVEKASDWVRGWAALTALGGNVGVTFKQTTSIPAFGFEIGLRKTAQHVLTAFSPAGMDAMRKIWNSEQRKTRWNVGSSEAVANALNQNNISILKRMFQASMITNKVGDVVPGLLVGQGIYRDCLEQGMSEEDAMAQTWMLIERTQQSSRLENQPKMQRRVRLGRMLYQFLSTQQQYLQYEMRAAREFKANPNSETAKGMIRAIAINHFLLTSLYYWMGELYKMLLGAEPPEDQLKDWMISNLMGPFGALFVLGSLCEWTLVRYFKGAWSASRENMLPMESFAKRQIFDIADVVGAIFENEGGFEEVTDSLEKWLNDSNAAFRDLRRIDKNYLRPEVYEMKDRRRRRRVQHKNQE